MTTCKSLSIDVIRTDGGTQMRAELTQEVYLDYRDKWLAGVEFDPVDVFHDGSVYWLADGFHRFYGAREAKRGSIPCRIHNGTQRDAILFACKANSAHGLRRTNADKRQSVLAMLNDEEWGKWSDARIAEHAAVSQQFVSSVRKQSEPKSGDTTIVPPPTKATVKRVGRDGKIYEVPKPQKPQKDKPKISGGTSFDVKEIEAATESEAESVGELFSKIFEHLGKVTRLLDDLKKVAPNAKLFDDVFASLECANQDLHKWKRGAK